MKLIITVTYLFVTLLISCCSKKCSETNMNDQEGKAVALQTGNSSLSSEAQENKQSKFKSMQDSILSTETNKIEENLYSNSQVEYSIINSENNTYGYEISIDNQLSISQTSIPGQPGNKGFSTKYKAEKTAKYIVNKIKNGIMPPTITQAELDSLGVLK